MTWSSRSTRAASKHIGWLVGLAVLGGGCSRPPVAPRPTAVYVSAEDLAHLHPLWKDVESLDRQIATLERFSPKPVRSPQAVNVRVPAPAAVAGVVNVAALQERINRSISEIQRREMAALEQRLRRIRASQRATANVAEQRAIMNQAEADIQRILDARGKELANLTVGLEALHTLDRYYASQGPRWDRSKIEAQIAQTTADISAMRDRRTAEVEHVFDEISAQLAEKNRQEAADTLQFLREHRQEQEAINASINQQKQMLLESLKNVSTPMTSSVSTRVSGPEPLLTTSTGAPPLPPAQLGTVLASLRARRAEMVQFIVSNTKAIVKTAAKRASEKGTPIVPLFTRTSPSMPDRTEQFRDDVRNAPASLRGT